MHPHIERLAELQAVDVRLTDLRGRLAAFPRQLAEIDGQVAAARQELATAKDALTTSVKDRKRYEMDVDSWKEKASKYRNQSFEVKSNEAYKALQHEITHAEGEASQAEDRLLDRMMAGEEYERQVEAAERAIVMVEAAAAIDRKKLQDEKVALETELEVKDAERKQKLSAIPENLLETYERVANRRHGIGLAEVRDQACTLCGVRVRPHVFQELRRADCHEIFQCETCTRIFYYIEPPPPVEGGSDGSSAPGHSGH